MTWLFEPGFFGSSQVHTGLAVGGIAALVSGVVGVFTVMRGQSFAGHALTDSAATGGAGALLVGLSPLLGFLAGSLAGAGAMEAVGVRRVRGRDLATGIVLGVSIGFASLLLYLTTTTTASTGSTQQILFGSIFLVAPQTVSLVIVLSVLSIGTVSLIYRPLLFSSVDPDMAATRGVPVGRIALAYMAALGSAVALSSLAIGAILSTALLIGPAATALRLTRRVGRAVVGACAIGVASTWLGVLLAYDSADWGSGHYTLPVSFFVVGIVFTGYLLSGMVFRISTRTRA